MHVGDPRQLLHPTDSDGRFCGAGNLIDRPYVYFFDWTKCVKALNIPANMLKSRPFVCPTTQVCVQQCPNQTSHHTFANYQQYRVCTYDVNVSDPDNAKLVKQGKCAPYVMASLPIFARCIPEKLQTFTNSIIQVADPIWSRKIGTCFSRQRIPEVRIRRSSTPMGNHWMAPNLNR